MQRSWKDVVWPWVFGAFAGGVGELAARTFMYQTSRTLSSPFHLNPQGFWMAPLMNFVILALPMLLVAFLVREASARRRIALWIALFAFGLEIGFISLRLHELATAMFAAGLATAAIRIHERWPAPTWSLMRWATGLLLAVSAGAGLWWNSKLSARVRAGMAALPSAGEGTPNVLLLILDTVRASNLSTYGYTRRTTPTLDSLARDGVQFDWAFTTAPWTLPSHATMFTGRYPHELSVQWSSALDTTYPTLAERLQSMGYATGGFVANLGYGMYVYGLDRGFIKYRDYAITPSEALGTTTIGRRLIDLWNKTRGRYVMPGAKRADRVVNEFLGWQETLGERPWFAFLNFYDAHSPYDPPAPYDTLYLSRQPVNRSVFKLKKRPGNELKDLEAAYDAGLSYIDRELDRMFRELRARGELDNTLIIVSSDHGEGFGEHGHTGHTTSLYSTLLRVPLIFRLPGSTVSNVRVDHEVTLRDLGATVLDVVKAGPERALPGESLARYWGTAPTDSSASPILSEVRQYYGDLPEWYPLATGDMVSLVRGGYHYIRRKSGKEELFRLRDDPMEQRDLAADSASAPVLQDMRTAVESALKTNPQ